jgi:hypothetical protein
MRFPVIGGPVGSDHQARADGQPGTPDYRDPANPLTRRIIQRYSCGDISGRKAAALLGDDASEHDVYVLTVGYDLPLPLPPPEEIRRQVTAAIALLERLERSDTPATTPSSAPSA